MLLEVIFKKEMRRKNRFCVLEFLELPNHVWRYFLDAVSSRSNHPLFRLFITPFLYSVISSRVRQFWRKMAHQPSFLTLSGECSAFQQLARYHIHTVYSETLQNLSSLIIPVNKKVFIVIIFVRICTGFSPLPESARPTTFYASRGDHRHSEEGLQAYICIRKMHS